MFAPPISKKAKPGTEGKSRAEPSKFAKQPSEANPIWQSLALHGIGLQTKLAISAPSDPSEQEADRVADRVMRMGGPDALPSSSNSKQNLQRKCAPCEEEEEKSTRRKERSAGVSSDAAKAAPPIVDKSLESTGQQLDPSTRAFFEPRFGQDFGKVRVHAGVEAANAARAVAARAFTVGRDIVFGSNQWSPNTDEGRRLLAHELAHVEQSTQPSVHSKNNNRVRAMLYRTPEQAQAITSRHTSWGNLDETALGRELLDRAQRGELTLVDEVFTALGSLDRDDVAYEFMVAANDAQIVQFAATTAGRRLLDRIFDELTAGSVASEEQQQADRIINATTRQTVSVGAFDAAATSRRTKVFPFRLPGLTVLNDAPIEARRVQGGIWVHSFVRVLGTDEFRSETASLPEEYFLGGIVLPENEVIGVRLYDQGGILIHTTPLFLIQLANATTQRVLEKIIEAAGIGLTLGSGALAGAGFEASMAARVLVWADRAAFVLGTLTSVLREHRSWLIEHFGQTFMDVVDTVHTVVAIYGMGRVAVEATRIILALRNGYRTFRESARSQSAGFSPSEQSTVQQVTQSTDELIEQIDNIQSARAASEGVAGGATRRGSQPPGRTETPPPALPERRHVSQIDEHGCGGACAEMSAEHHGVRVTEAEMLRQPEFIPRASEASVQALGEAVANRTAGFTGPRLVSALERQAAVPGRQWVYQDLLPPNAGVTGPVTVSQVRQGVVNGLQRGNGVFIARVDMGRHWMVVDGLQGDLVLIRDPAGTAAGTMPLATFLGRWLGEAVVAVTR